MVAPSTTRFLLSCAVVLHIVVTSAAAATTATTATTATGTFTATASDKRIKSNIQHVDPSSLLDQISRLKVVDFDYDHEQFYNPLFGKTHSGFVAQQVLDVMPRAVGVVKQRKIPNPNDAKNPIVLENLHVLNQEAIFIANVGATQELLRLTKELTGNVTGFSEQTTAHDDRLHKSIQDLKDQQEKLQTLSEAAQSKGELALNEAQSVRQSQAQIIADANAKAQSAKESLDQLRNDHRIALTDMTAKIGERVSESEAQLRAEIEQGLIVARTVGDIVNTTTSKIEQINGTTARVAAQLSHMQHHVDVQVAALTRQQAESATDLRSLTQRVDGEIKVEMDETRTNLLKMKSKLDDAIVKLDNADEALAKDIATNKENALNAFDKVHSSLEQLQLSMAAEVAKNALMMNQTKQHVDELVATIASAKEDAAESAKEASETAINAAATYTDSQVASLRANLTAELSQLADQHRLLQRQVEQTHETIEELRSQVERQAAAEVIERRKMAEAQAQEAQAKIELEVVKAQEQRQTARLLEEQELAREARTNATSRARVEQEEAIRKERELHVLQAQEESILRQQEHHAAMQERIAVAQAQANLAQHELERNGTVEAARIQAESAIEQERRNRDVREAMLRAQADEDRKRMVEGIQVAVEQVRKTVEWLRDDPRVVTGVAGLAIAVVVCALVAREVTSVLRKRVEQSLGRPSLVRESSQSGLLAHLFGRKPGALSLSSESKATMASVRRAFSDVVLSSWTFEQVSRICIATSTAHSRLAPLRHIMFYGPPGTGKTMVAKRMAQSCGLDYAIMSGADVAPLQEQAVTEIHALFKWANRTPRGVLLFIDEADAFLCSRSGAKLSESAKNALTALLYHTGAPTCKVMMVLATNRPQDIDSAVLDRVDESVQFCKPGAEERLRLVQHYFNLHVAELSLQKFQREQAAREKARHASRWGRLAAVGAMVMRRGLISRSRVSSTGLIDVCGINEQQLKEIAQVLEGFSGREIAKLMVTVQAHAFAFVDSDGSDKNNNDVNNNYNKSKAVKKEKKSKHDGAFLDGPMLQHVVHEMVERHVAVTGYQSPSRSSYAKSGGTVSSPALPPRLSSAAG